jgi:thymidylate synthase (FAD)
MPHIETLTPKSHKFKILFGQRPLTRFKDYRKSISVKLLAPESKENMMNRIYGFVNATWADDPSYVESATTEQKLDALNQMLSGKALQLGLETVNFTFLISGISRVDTHQIVRQRIGVTFSQQCTGDRMMHHNDILVEECIAKDPDQLAMFLHSTLENKNSYSSMIDNGISIQAARSILPHNLETFIWMNTNLATLLFFHQKRIDDGSQTWQINEIAQQMADRVCEVYPELKEVFERNKKKFKFQREASADRKNTFSTGLYVPKEDEFDYHERDFLYPSRKNSMHFTNTPTPDKFYWGYSEITKDQYDAIKGVYDELDRQIHENNFSNEKIKQLAQNATHKLERELGIA